MNNGVALIAIGKLRSHEAVSSKRVRELVERIRKDGCLKNPVVADQETLVVLDGHHRVAALKRLGVKKAPVSLVDYKNGEVRVYLRQKEILMKLIKEAVIQKGLSGEVFPAKTTRHLIQSRVRNINYRLKKLL